VAKDQACDLCDPDAPTLGFAMISILGTGDVKIVCPACFISMGDAMAAQITADLDNAGPVDALTPAGPVDDPISGDQTDDDAAADGAAPPAGDSADVPHVGALAIETRSDATPGPLDTVPAEPF
jgi:hypothetical protein